MHTMDFNRIHVSLEQVTERLKHLKRPERERELITQHKDDRKIIGLFPRDFGMDPWDWPQGVGLYGMMNRYHSDGDKEGLNYCINWFEGHLSQKLPARNINTTCPLLTLADISDKKAEYGELCEDWAQWIMNELPRTREGGFQHTTTKDASKGTLNINENQIWIDTLFMTVLFLGKWGIKTNNEEYIQEAIHQYLIMIKYLYQKTAGLFYHAWTFTECHNFGEVFWCRGNCWYTASVLDFIQSLGTRLPAAVREVLTDTYKAQVEALLHLQAESGLWHTVLDDPSSYEETSGSAGIVYGILRGIHTGILPESYMGAVQRAINGILEQIGEDGTVGMVSAGTPVGKDREHYKNIMIAPMAYGQSLCMMALVEALKTQSKKGGEKV